MRRSSKIVPNNGPLAVAARGGEVIEKAEVPQPLDGFEPWNSSQPAYDKWFRKRMKGQPCQCGCHRIGSQVHHEDRGAHKDDRTIVWLSRRCHHDVRHHHSCSEWFVLLCRALAGENWRDYGDALEP